MAPKRASKQQQQLNVDQFKLLKKPMDHLGKQINVPGSFWEGRMLQDERDKVYKCTIVDFSLAHKFAPDSSPRNAFKMQEMGIDGTGSHEESDLASTMYWIDYPLPFLRSSTIIHFQQLMTGWPELLRWHRWRAPQVTAAPAVPQMSESTSRPWRFQMPRFRANLYLPPFPARIFHAQLPLCPNMESTSSTSSASKKDIIRKSVTSSHHPAIFMCRGRGTS
jgi:hypothetical protein